MSDAVDHPAHYAAGPGPEVIEMTEHMDFLRGNVVKYVCRAGKKDGADELQDLQKAAWYLNRAISKVELEREVEADAVRGLGNYGRSADS